MTTLCIGPEPEQAYNRLYAEGSVMAMEPAMAKAVELPPLFSLLPKELSGHLESGAPWALVTTTLNEILAELPHEDIRTRLGPDIHLMGNRISIGKGARIHPGVVIEGPIRIGNDVQIRPGAYLRGGVWIGDGCIIGASTEVKHSILLDGAAAPHLNYVGDSILGERVNLGAGTILSNFRHDGREIHIPAFPPDPNGMPGDPIGTESRKLGAILGDEVKTGCNCVLHPGTIVGRRSQLYPGLQLRAGVYPAERILKLRQEIETVERR
ncbi:MAG: hypothetical protein OES47_03480 [Acidobacteriota bacterium]|nr:hypothetical protein [Acidobacteriota bacterium]